MESKQKLIVMVKSPAKDAHLREGNGFSLKEIKESGKTTTLLEQLNIKIDYFRKSSYSENIKKLKSIEVPKKKRAKREPFVKKEKKRTPFKPKEEKPRIKRAPKPKVTAKKPVKPKPKVVKKEKPIIKEKAIVEEFGTPLTNLSGLGAATAKKFIELGVNSMESLIKENPEELALLIKGVSEERLKKWIEEANEILKP
ncbi:MAG: helix-hairpin-helix domain-containing protein [Promethearchaeota archaeon]